MSVIRCCGGALIGCTCRPTVRSSAGSAARRRSGTLVTVCALVLASPVATAAAQDAPQPPPLLGLPAMPAMPTVSVQVNVDIPAVTVNVQEGTVAVSVSTESVTVSVSVPTPVATPTGGAAGAQPQPEPEPEQQTRHDDPASACCNSGEKEVAPAVTLATTARAPRATVPDRPRPIRTAARPVQLRATPKPRVERPRRLAATQHAPRRALARRAKSAPTAVVEPAAAIPRVPRAEAGPRTDTHERSPVRAADLSVEQMRDNRLLLQLGLLGALLYLACLAGWVSATTLKRRRA